MERLQAAIMKARHDQPGFEAEKIAPEQQDVGDKWDALKPVELESAVLQRSRIFTTEVKQEAVAFDILRTRTLRYMQKKGWTRLAITSPTPSCGKSTISLNLAFAMARQAGTRAVQIEVDMRRPSQRRLMGLNKGKPADDDTLSGLFSGQTDFADVALRYGDRLALATNGQSVSNASDLLLGSQVGWMLQKIEDDFQPDVMIFDMPPVLVNDDTMAFLQHVDCVLIVAAAESSTVEEVEKCERDLASQTNVLGVVLNKCRLQSGNGKYGYGNTYGY